jgi:hypothetical protein
MCMPTRPAPPQTPSAKEPGWKQHPQRAAAGLTRRICLAAAAALAVAAMWHPGASAQGGAPEGPIYAADFPGSDLGAKVNAAVAALSGGGTIALPAGSYAFSTPIVLDKPVWLTGQGVHGTVLSYTGSGASIVVEVGGQAPYLSGGLRGFELAAAEPGGGVGILQVNTIGFTYEELAVLHFGVGIWLDNRPAADCPACDGAADSERTDWERVSFFENGVGLEFTNDGGTNSMEYSWMWACHFQINNGQIGIWVEGDGNVGSVYLQHSDMNFMANICLSDPAGPLGTVVSVTDGGFWGQGFVQATAEQSCGTTPSVMWDVDGTSSVDAFGTYDPGSLTNDVTEAGSLALGATLPPSTTVGDGAVVRDRQATLSDPVLAGATLESALVPAGSSLVSAGTIDASQGSLIVPPTVESNGAVLTLPAQTDTIVGAATPASLTDKTLISPALTDPTIGGETITEPPHVALAFFAPGALSSQRTVAQWIPDHPIVLTDIAATAGVGPLGCPTPAVLTVSQGAAEASVPLTAQTVDSGQLNLALEGGRRVALRVSQAAACTGPRRPKGDSPTALGATAGRRALRAPPPTNTRGVTRGIAPANVEVVLQYRAQ